MTLDFAGVLSSIVATVEITELQSLLRAFAEERDWDQFHSIRNLVLAMVGEVGEVAELLQWMDDSKVSDFLDTGGRERLGEEISDVLFYLLRVADIAKIDLGSAVNLKLQKNELKYPVSKAKGSSKKYSDLVEPK